MNTYNQPNVIEQPKVIPPKVKKQYEFNNKDFAFLIFNVIATYLFLRLGVLGAFNVGFTVTYVLMHLGYFIYSFKRATEHKFLYFVTLGIEIVLCTSFFLHDNGLIKFVTVIALTFLSAFTLNGISSSYISTDGTFIKVLDVLFVFCIEPFINIVKLVRAFFTALKTKNNKILLVLLGVLVSVPFLFLVVPLLSSADAAFNSIIKRVFSDIAAMIFSIFLTVILLPMTTSYSFTTAKGITADKNISFNSKPGKIPAIFLNTILSVISFIYVVFLVSQLAYISDTFAFLLPADYTAAEFARSGFFQMSAITALNLFLTFLVSVIEKPKANGRLPLSTKLILTFFTAFSLFLTVNSFIRMSMYIDMYGLTQLRVLTRVFMIMLCVIFVIVLIRIFFERFKYFNWILITCALTCVLISVTNVDTHISKYNYLKYTQGEIGVDFEHFEDLGCAAVPELIKLANSDDYLDSRLAQNALKNIADREFSYDEDEGFKYEKKLTSYNVTKNRAGIALQSFFKEFKEIEAIDTDFSDYKKRVEEYGAGVFMPDFNTIDKSFSSLALNFDSDYDSDEDEVIELTFIYDNLIDYNNAFNKLNLTERTKSTFEYEGYTFVLLDLESLDMPREIGLIAYSEEDMKISYLWYSNDETEYADISDLEEFCNEKFSLYFC